MLVLLWRLVLTMKWMKCLPNRTPQMQLAMDICDVPMEERQKMEEEFTVVLTIKKREKDITLVLKGNEQENTLVIKKSEH